MLKIQTIELTTLKGRNKTAYKRLIHPDYCACLSGFDPLKITGSELLAIAALVDGKPIGLIVGAFRPHDVPAEIYSFYVEEEHRRQGIGAQLLEAFEALLISKGSSKIKISYLGAQDWTSNLELLLKHQQWLPSSQVSIKCFFNLQTFNPDWLHKNHPLPAGCEIFLWKKLTTTEKKEIEAFIEQRAIPFTLSPFRNEKHIDWTTSLGIRDETQVLGWIVNLRPSKELIEYKSFFIFREYHLQGHSMRLLTESIHLAQKKPPRHAVLQVFLNNVDYHWVKFVKRRLLPYTERVERFYEAWKVLTPDEIV